MHYFALLLSEERDRTPDDPATAMAAWERFHAKAGAAILAGDALTPAATGVRVTGGTDAPLVTDGPFAESAPRWPAATTSSRRKTWTRRWHWRATSRSPTFGAVEVWPVVHFREPARELTGNDWLALLLEPPATAHTPGTPEWEAVAARHGDFATAAGDHIIGGAALHDRSTATTVRVRDGETLITDGPFVEGAEIATGVYLLAPATVTRPSSSRR